MMPNVPDEALATALIDVRRAYRLLWAFQKRILDYKMIIYNRLGFSEWGPVSLLGRPGSTGNAVWSQLPMADVEFRAIRRHGNTDYAPGRGWGDYPKINDSVIYIRLRADTGMPLIVRNDTSPLTFNAVENCKTKLLLFIVLNRVDRDQPSNFWAASEACRNIPTDREQATQHPTIVGFDFFGMDVNLATLPDESTVVSWVDAFKEQYVC